MSDQTALREEIRQARAAAEQAETCLAWHRPGQAVKAATEGLAGLGRRQPTGAMWFGAGLSGAAFHAQRLLHEVLARPVGAAPEEIHLLGRLYGAFAIGAALQGSSAAMAQAHLEGLRAVQRAGPSAALRTLLPSFALLMGGQGLGQDACELLAEVPSAAGEAAARVWSAALAASCSEALAADLDDLEPWERSLAEPWLGVELLVRGRFPEALRWLELPSPGPADWDPRGPLRAAALAMVGRREEAREEARPHLGIPGDPTQGTWRRACALQGLLLAGEDVLPHLESFRPAPEGLSLPLGLLPVAECRARLDAASVERLGRVAAAPALGAHHAAAQALLEDDEGAALRLLDGAEQAAEQADSLWGLLEVAHLRARIYRSRIWAGAFRRQRCRALELAEACGWPARAAELREELGTEGRLSGPADVLARSLHELGGASGEVGDVLARLLHALGPLVPSDAAWAAVVEGDGLRPVLGVPLREDLLPRVVQSQRPLTVDGLWTAIPVLVDGEVAGLVGLTRFSGPPFAPGEVDLAFALAGQAGVAAENARWRARSRDA